MNTLRFIKQTFRYICIKQHQLFRIIATGFLALQSFNICYSFDIKSNGIYYNIIGDNYVEVTYGKRLINTYSGSISIPSHIFFKNKEYQVLSIGKAAFSLCERLKAVTIPEGLKRIDDYAFYECHSIERIDLPNSIEYLGKHAFQRCLELRFINIPPKIKTIKKGSFFCCRKLENIIFPDDLLEIEELAFADTSIKSIALPRHIMIIGDEAFSECTILTNVFIPYSNLSIGKKVFFNSNLKEITFPPTIISLNLNSLDLCKNLTKVTSYIMEPQLSESPLLISFQKCTLYIPHDTKDKYLSTFPWNTFGTIVEMEP